MGMELVAVDRAEELRRRMVNRLDGDGGLGPWREALLSVPRHEFVPEVIWHETSSGFVPLRRTDDPDAWLGLAYADRALVVQVDDGRLDGIGRCASSTMLSPYDLSIVLSAIDAEPGMRVCEIGTGTGYTAAVLAHRLGAEAVTTVEVDPELAWPALRRLRSAGHQVAWVEGDGARGHPGHGAYDRLVSSATVQRVPYAWVEQVRPGGLIATSWGTPYHGEALLRLTVGEDGTAVGGIVGATLCEWLRAQRVCPVLHVTECAAGLARTGTTDLEISDIAAGYDDAVAIGLRVPGCASVFIPPDDQWFVDPGTGSWARLHERSRKPNLVNQYGPRSLWDEIENACRWWLDNGRPPAGAWQFTVTPDGMTARLPGCPGATVSLVPGFTAVAASRPE